MRASVFWIEGPWLGRLAILLRPRGGEWLDAETRAWREASLDGVVSLLEPSEETELDLGREATSAAANGLAFRSFPIPDRSVPSSREAVGKLVADLSNALEAGDNIGFHCRQGIGRSGLMTAATLIAAGEDVDTALRKVTRARGLTVPETDEQRRWISAFASWHQTSRL
jgi:protein-tyrosine phosphatase